MRLEKEIREKLDKAEKGKLLMMKFSGFKEEIYINLN